MNKPKIFVLLLLIPLLIAIWASASAENSAIPTPVNVQTEIFRISSNLGSEPIAPDQLKASVPITGDATIYSSTLVWGENIELLVDGRPFCNGTDSTANCIIEQNSLIGGTSVIAVNFNAKLIPSGAHKFTVTTYPMPSPGGYSNTSDSIWILVN